MGLLGTGHCFQMFIGPLALISKTMLTLNYHKKMQDVTRLEEKI